MRQKRNQRKSRHGSHSDRRLFRLRATSTTYDDGWEEEDGREPLTIPTRWVKLVFAIFLLPVLWIFAQSFFNVFSHTAVNDRFWFTEEFWFFSLGLVLWLITFFGLPKMVVVYVFGHELTHALWVILMGGRVSRFEVHKDGGAIETDTNNFWIALAPYFFPIYSMLVIALYCVVARFYDLTAYQRLLFALIGITWGFHLTFTLWMIPKGQSDLTAHGTFFSLVLIMLLNMIVLSGFLIVASPHINLLAFGHELVNNAATFSAWTMRHATHWINQLLAW